MGQRNYYQVLMFGLSSILCCTAGLALAEEENHYTVALEAGFSPDSALVISRHESGTRSHTVKRPVHLVSIQGDYSVVKIDTQPEDFAAGTLLSLISHREQGVTSVSALFPAKVDESEYELREPICREEDDKGSSEELKESSLKKLIKIRRTKREVLLERLLKKIEQIGFEHISELEDRYGLSYERKFSSGLSAEELVHRLLVLDGYLRSGD